MFIAVIFFAPQNPLLKKTIRAVHQNKYDDTLAHAL